MTTKSNRKPQAVRKVIPLTMNLMARMSFGCIAATVVVAVAIAGWWVANPATDPARAAPDLAVGIDLDPSGNTATSLGTVDTCRIVDAGTTFEVDIYIEEVVDLASWQARMSFDPNVLEVIAHDVVTMFQATTGAISIMFDTSEQPPGSNPGLYRVGAADLAVNTPGSGDSGSGVLARVTFQALQNGPSPISIAPIDLNQDGELRFEDDVGLWLLNSVGGAIGDADGNLFFDGPIGGGGIDVGGVDTDSDGLVDGCDPDDDNDGVCDAAGPLPDGTPGTAPGGCDAGASGSDNCLSIANPLQEDIDADGQGDACDSDIDGDAVLNDDDNCPTVSNSSQANEDGDVLGDACDPDDDGDGYWDDKENSWGSDPFDTLSTPEVCDLADNDGDLEVDEGYDYSRPGGGPPNGVPDCQEDVDSDGDGLPNTVDDDDDGDGTSDLNENYIATDSLAACSSTHSLDAWPPDVNQDNNVNIFDFVALKPFFGSQFGTSPEFSKRVDFYPNGIIDIFDVVRLKPAYGESCTG